MDNDNGKDGTGSIRKNQFKRKRGSEDDNFVGDGYSSDEDFGNDLGEEGGHDSSSEEERHEAAESFSAAEAARRQQRLEKNRKKARDRRNRKKVMIEEMQRSVVVISRMNDELRRKNQELTKKLAQFGRVGQVASVPRQPLNISQGALLGTMLPHQSPAIETGMSPADLYRIAAGGGQQQIQIPQPSAAEVGSPSAQERLLLGQGATSAANSSMGLLSGLPNVSAVLSGLPAVPSNEGAALRYLSQQQQGLFAAGIPQNRLQQGPSALAGAVGFPPTILSQQMGSNTNSRPVHIVVHHHHGDPGAGAQEGALAAIGTGAQHLTAEPQVGDTVLSSSQETLTAPFRNQSQANSSARPPNNRPGNSG